MAARSGLYDLINGVQVARLRVWSELEAVKERRDGRKDRREFQEARLSILTDSERLLALALDVLANDPKVPPFRGTRPPRPPVEAWLAGSAGQGSGPFTAPARNSRDTGTRRASSAMLVRPSGEG